MDWIGPHEETTLPCLMQVHRTLSVRKIQKGYIAGAESNYQSQKE